MSTGVAIFFPKSTPAQVVPDNTLGRESSIVTPLDPTTQRIDGGAVRDSHLFHSFLEFGIPAETGIYFAEPDSISTIFSRVTGNNPSEIYGTLGVLGDADLFLLNPNGILFGTDARLDMEGSFVGSTATQLILPDGTKFSATAPAALPTLDIQVEVPVGLVFEGVAPGVIVNAGNLEVGQNLLLAGGTIVSSGNLMAPAGDMAVVTAVENDVPAQVEVSQTGKLIAVASEPVERDLQPQPLLSQWSTQAELAVNNGRLTVDNQELAVVTGDIIVRQAAAESSILSAANNLTLFDSTVTAQGNLELLAQNVIHVSDRNDQPLIIAAAGDLLVQGNQGIDIFVLNHPESGLFSGRDMTLISGHPIVSDAHFYTNGSFTTQGLDDSSQSILSTTDPVILAGGNVTLGDYQTGTSLHILAGGNVELGAVPINGPGPVNSTINLNNTNLVNGSLTYANLAIFELPDYKVTVNREGSFSREQVLRRVEIDGSAEATLDVRAGIDWDKLGGPPVSPAIVGSVLPDFSAPAVDGSITVNGDIDIAQPDGRVVLTNQYMPNERLPGGTIETQEIDVSSNGVDNAGDIFIYGRGDIVTNEALVSSAFSRTTSVGNAGEIALSSSTGDIIAVGRLEAESASLSSIDPRDSSGDGGQINLSTSLGNITASTISTLSLAGFTSGNGGEITLSSDTGDIETNIFLISSSTSTFGRAGNGGNVTLATDTGNISARNSINARAFSLDSTAGGGGAVSIVTNSGSVSVNGDLNSFSGSLMDNAGNAGEIILSAMAGDVIGMPGTTLNSFVYAPEGTAGVGGDVVINAKNEISNLEVLTLSTSANSGNVNISGTGDLSIRDSDILTNQQITFTVPNSGPVTLDIGEEQGQSGDVTIVGTGNITFNNTVIESDTKGVDVAGDVTISSPGRVVLNNSGILSNTSSSGEAGTIELNASEVVLTGTVELDNIEGPSRLLAQTMGDGAAGNLVLKPFAQGQTLSLLFENGNQISAATQSTGRGGNITLSALEAVTVTGLGELSASTTSNGLGGNITVDTATFTLKDGAQLTASSIGSGVAGDISLFTGETTVQNGASVSVSNPQGQAGNIRVDSNLLTLDEGQITAETGGRIDQSSGANIILQLTDNLILSNESLISAEAFDQANGGNIEIEGQFVIGLPVMALNRDVSPMSPLNGSDIIAIADRGDGGRITISALGIFGIEERQAVPGNQTNDIDASSEFGIPGQVDLSTLDDPSRNLTVLPTEPINTQVAEACYSQSGATNVTLFVLGLGGIPSDPDDVVGPNLVLEEWLSLDGKPETSQNPESMDETTHLSVDSRLFSEEQLIINSFCHR